MPSTIVFLSYLALGLAAFASIVGSNPAPSLTARDFDAGLSGRSDVDAIHRRVFQPEPRTNAERLRRGLSPLPPKRRTNRSRLQARQSSTPPPTCNPTTVTGYIAVTTAGTPNNGYVGAANNNGEFTLVATTTGALHVSISTCSSGPIQFSILNHGGAGYTLLGAVQGAGSTNTNLGIGSTNYMQLTEVAHTDLGSVARSVGNSFSHTTPPMPSESTIWTMGANGEITATWINSNGSPAPATIIYYVPSSNEFVLVGDVSEVQSSFQGAVATWTFIADS